MTIRSALKERESGGETLEWGTCKSQGASKDPGKPEKQPGELWTPSGRTAEGGGVPEKTAQFRSCPEPPYLCQRVPARNEPAGSTEFPRRGRGRRTQKEDAPLASHIEAVLSPNTPKPADGGNSDYTQTRTHARTPDATSPGACASARKPHLMHSLRPSLSPASKPGGPPTR